MTFESNKGFLKDTQNSPYLEGKILKVPRFRKCVLASHQKKVRFQKL
jgi:hypothetical protein